MDEWLRAIAFVRSIDERCAEEVVAVRWGHALINRTLWTAPDVNYLLASTALETATAQQLTKETERIQGQAGIPFRRVNVDDQESAERLMPQFKTLGFSPERFCVMVRRRPPDRVEATDAIKEVGWDTYRAGRRRAIESWAPTGLIAAHALAKNELTASVIATSFIAAVVRGEPASFCELRREGSAAQIEFVETLAPFRRRGLARQVVTAALERVRESEFVFLVADLFDWPQHFYERLGFQTVGIESRFMRHAGV
jgi:ribosomal protein S18 acetylase RimI-like enzyme